jgi:rhomboid protease GluP
LFALYVLGPPLERAIGAVRFSFCYLIAGLGSSAGVVLLTLVRVAHADQLVGASGCVMGIVGAWGAYLLRRRHTPLAKQRLTNVVMIVAIQVAFDLSTPQISMAAHLCGLLTGFLVGLVVGPKKMSIYQSVGA